MIDNVDQLYELLPVIYRLRDAEQGYRLKALLRVIGEQVNVARDDIQQLYDNWFIETAEDWVVPYIGDLIGYRPVHQAGEPGDPRDPEGAARNRILIPRRDVANTIHNRRRKGTLLLLQQLANDMAGWPARAVEFYTLVGWLQNLDHLHLTRARTVDVRDGAALDRLGGPFEREAHTVDVRAVNSPRTRGRFNIPNVGVFVWRLKTYSVTDTPAARQAQDGPHCYTFSVLGQDTPLYLKSVPLAELAHIARELDVPDAIRRHPFEQHLRDYYGPGKSVQICADWAGYSVSQPIPTNAIIAADLTGWTYEPPRNHIAVDPVLGRIAFPPAQVPERVRVSYSYAFSADVGGGEYNRGLSQPRQALLYRVGEDQTIKRINDALAQWQSDREKATTKEDKRAKANAVIELTDSHVYREQLAINLDADTSLQLRATNGKRPIIRLIDWETDASNSLTIALGSGSRMIMDGLLVTGYGVEVRSSEGDATISRKEATCASQLTIRHCTLVPGWGLNNDCSPQRLLEPSLELFNVRARVRIEHSILGPIDVNEDETRDEPIPITIIDSVVDSNRPRKEAIGAPGAVPAHVRLTIRRCTVFGIVAVFALDLAENSIFEDCVNVKRHQIGCVRFCYVPTGCRTPRRYHCKPDLAEQAAEADLRASGVTDDSKLPRARSLARALVQPQFTSDQFGTPVYCQLADTCPDEIKRGADDESELGVFHNLFQPQRLANLSARLDEYTPADLRAGIIMVN